MPLTGFILLAVTGFFTTPAEGSSGAEAHATKSDTLQTVSPYQEGFDLLETGDTLGALSVWEEARSMSPDPRIGIVYAEVASAASMAEFYETASDIYFWSFSGDSLGAARSAVEEEVERLVPLLDLRLRSRWRRMAEEGDPRLLREISGFWKQMDPTPGTEYNERLIEHWERIAHARAHFTRSSSEPYGTDDRGPVYVRYGRADLVQSGQLGYNSAESRGLIADIVMYSRGDEFDVRVGDVINSWVKLIRGYAVFPEYEIWIYRDLVPQSADHTIFMFGTNPNAGNFEQVQTVEDFIQNQAFSAGRAWTSEVETNMLGWPPAANNIRPGLILQMIYYNQLSTVDPFFGEMRKNIAERALNYGVSLSASLGQEMRGRATSRLNEIRVRSPRHESAHKSLMRDIPVQVHQYRLLDEDNRPVLATFVQSEPQTAVLTDYLYNYSSEESASVSQISSEVRRQAEGQRSRYRLVHSVRTFGDRFTERASDQAVAPVVISRNARSESFLRIPHDTASVQQVFSAELFNSDAASTYQGDRGLFPAGLRGLGKAELPQSEPLGTDPGRIEMGDLIMGYGMEEASGDDPWPFTITHDRQIPAGEALAVHVELYHLQQDGQGIADFALSYEVLERNPAIIRWIDRYRSNTELTLNLQTDSDRYTEDLEIRTRELEPGTYLLKFTATDAQTGQEIEREVEFEVMGE